MITCGVFSFLKNLMLVPSMETCACYDVLPLPSFGLNGGDILWSLEPGEFGVWWPVLTPPRYGDVLATWGVVVRKVGCYSTVVLSLKASFAAFSPDSRWMTRIGLRLYLLVFMISLLFCLSGKFGLQVEVWLTSVVMMAGLIEDGTLRPETGVPGSWLLSSLKLWPVCSYWEEAARWFENCWSTEFGLLPELGSGSNVSITTKFLTWLNSEICNLYL